MERPNVRRENGKASSLRGSGAIRPFLAATCSVAGIVFLAICYDVGTAQEALLPIDPPSFAVGGAGYWCNAIYPNGSWTFTWSAGGNGNPCAGTSGATMVRTGIYRSDLTNRVDLWCSGGAWTWTGIGSAPLQRAHDEASLPERGNNCFFRVTAGTDQARSFSVNNGILLTKSAPSDPLPAPDESWIFYSDRFFSSISNQLARSNPAPAGYQVTLRTPGGSVLHQTPGYNNTAAVLSPERVMTSDRRTDLASMSKTITAMATVAALQDLQDNTPPSHGYTNAPTLDSKIAPYLPSSWAQGPNVSNITFRMLLAHTSGLCYAPSSCTLPNARCSDDGVCGSPSDMYADLRAMIASGACAAEQPQAPDYHATVDRYCNPGYGLLRILIPYLVDGPHAYDGLSESSSDHVATIENVTSMSYRNYVRGRILERVGLDQADLFHTGDRVETIYYRPTAGVPVPDRLNIAGACADFSECDMRPNSRVRNAASGNWTLSPPEYLTMLSGFWSGSSGKIVSDTNRDAMLPPYFNTTARAQGLGFISTRDILPDGTTVKTSYFKSGGGMGVGAWATYHNGYSALFQANTLWGFGSRWTSWRLLRKAGLAALVPRNWTCNYAYYNQKAVSSGACDDCGSGTCHTGCGAIDPDCN